MNQGKGRGKKHLSFGVHKVIRTDTQHKIDMVVLTVSSVVSEL